MHEKASEQVNVDYAAVFESAPTLLLVLGPNDRFPILNASNAYLHATYTKREAVVGRPLFEVFPDNPAEDSATGTLNLRASLTRVLNDRVSDTMAVQKYDIPRPDENGGGFEVRYWLPVNAPVLSAEGEILYIVHRVDDVTELVLSDQALIQEGERVRLAGAVRDQQLQEANRRLREVTEQFQAMYDQGLFAARLSLDGTVIDINRSALEVCGFKREDVLGRPFWECGWWNLSADVKAWVRGAVEQAVSGEPFRGKSRYFWGDGSEHIVDFACMPIRDDAGNVVIVVPTGMDITEQVEVENQHRELEAERRRAEALAEIDEAKTKFFSNISHEFRTPLTLMAGPLEDLLADGTLDPADRDRADLALRNARRLLKLVNSLLDFSRIEAGRVEASYEPTRLAEFTAELASLFRSAIESAGMTLTVDCASSDEAYVDREMWEKIVLNLLSNAFKFTFEGGITVSLRQVEGSFELAISDTGTGIASDELPRLFERFHQVKGANGRSFEGTGIGLALVQELVRLHGGTTEVQSELGKGSRFIVRIPTGKAHLAPERIFAPRTQVSTGVHGGVFVEEALGWIGEQPPAAITPTEIGKEEWPKLAVDGRPVILWADDNADMRGYVERLLAAAGYEVVLAEDGEKALSLAQARNPDLILSDVMMPRLDGFGLLEAVRGDPALAAIPFILLSARAGEETRVEGMRAGATDYIVKPFSARELLTRISASLDFVKVRDRANIDIRKSEERLRALVTASAYVIYRMNADWSRMLELEGRGFLSDAQDNASWLGSYIAPEDQPLVAATIENAIRSKSMFALEHRVIKADGELGWTLSRAVPLLDANGDIQEWFGAASDITERMEADKTQKLLLAELNHRVKNMLAIVQAIAQQTARSTTDPSEFSERFAGRVRSLSRVHSLLTTATWQGTDLRTLIEDQLLQVTVDNTRLVATGPDVHLEPQEAVNLALLLHELATNSTKYGALSVPAGHVSIAWYEKDGVLNMVWTEQGGPPVPSAGKDGFGTTLIKQISKGAGGNAEMVRASKGVIWNVSLNLARRVSNAPKTQAPDQQSQDAAQNSPDENLAGLDILVIEDEPLIAMNLLSVLENANAREAVAVGSKEDAFQALERGRFDCVLLDGNLTVVPSTTSPLFYAKDASPSLSSAATVETACQQNFRILTS